MELPSLHEQIILSRCRHFFASVKTTSNTRGHVNFSRHKIKLHAILFAHDAPDIASKLLTTEEMLDEKHLKQTLRMCLVDEKGKFDNLAREAFGSNQLLARPWVLCQWLAVLKEVHPWCDFIILPDFQLLRKKIEEANDHMMQTAERFDDKEAIDCEDALGSDIAQAQSTEVERNAQPGATTTSAECHLDGETEEESCDTPMQCRCVLAQPSASIENDQLLQATCL
jgi:hypothetical protein